MYISWMRRVDGLGGELTAHEGGSKREKIIFHPVNDQQMRDCTRGIGLTCV